MIPRVTSSFRTAVLCDPVIAGLATPQLAIVGAEALKKRGNGESAGGACYGSCDAVLQRWRGVGSATPAYASGVTPQG